MAQLAFFPSDRILPGAAMVYDRTRLVKARPEAIFPWLVQSGKGRGGCYLTSFWEQLLPQRWRANHQIELQWQTLVVGDRIEDYGKDEWLEVVSIGPPKFLVLTSEHFGTVFTWALLLHPKIEDTTQVHLRFRGRIQSVGWRRRVIVFGGDLLDWVAASPMLAGLAERVERTDSA